MSSDLGGSQEASPTRSRSAEPVRSSEADAAPVTPRGRAGSASAAAPASRGVQTGTGRNSQVAERVNLFESLSRKGKFSTASSSSAQLFSSQDRAPKSTEAQLSLLSQMRQEQEKEKEKADAQLKMVMEKFRQVKGRESPGSPESPASASEPGSPGGPGEEEGSPRSRVMCSLVKDLADDMKSRRKMADQMMKAFFRVMDMKGVFSNEHRWRDPAQSESEVITPSSASAPVLGLAEAVEAEAAKEASQELSEEEVSELAPLRSAARLSCKSSASCKTESKVSLSEVDTTVGHSEMDSSRHSHSTGLPDDAEPAREAQAKESRYSTPSWMRADLKTQRDEDDDTLPASPCSRGPETAAARDEENSLDASVDTSVVSVECDESGVPSDSPQAGQEGMPYVQTYLYALEQAELHRSMTLIVPEGMDQTRLVVFNYEGEQMRVTIPEGYDVGQQVQISVPTGKRPPLEPSALTAWHRGHHNYPNRHTVVEPLRHCCRISQAEGTNLLQHPEYMQRYNLYALMQGKSMTPLLPDMPEGDEDQEAL